MHSYQKEKRSARLAAAKKVKPFVFLKINQFHITFVGSFTLLNLLIIKNIYLSNKQYEWWYYIICLLYVYVYKLNRKKMISFNTFAAMQGSNRRLY